MNYPGSCSNIKIRPVKYNPPKGNSIADADPLKGNSVADLDPPKGYSQIRIK
jgi:hypothetical protein